LSEATLEKFLDRGFLTELYDIYHMDRFRDEIMDMEGFGLKSYDNMIASIEKSRSTELTRVLYGLGIINVGRATARLICKRFDNDIEKIIKARVDELSEIDGIGGVIAEGVVAYFADANNVRVLRSLMSELDIIEEKVTAEQDLAGKTFVITGSLNSFANRDELKRVIEDRGGKVAGSVSSKTSYLINNDLTSNSSKNKKAKELNVPIISEEMFVNGEY
jgi:DNA ligase (NAD+)